MWLPPCYGPGYDRGIFKPPIAMALIMTEEYFGHSCYGLVMTEEYLGPQATAVGMTEEYLGHPCYGPGYDI